MYILSHRRHCSNALKGDDGNVHRRDNEDGQRILSALQTFPSPQIQVVDGDTHSSTPAAARSPSASQTSTHPPALPVITTSFVFRSPR